MSLSKVIEEIKKVKPFVDEDVESGPRETLAGRRGRKAQAIERMQTLKFEYRQELIQSAVFIIVTGDKRNELTAIATDNFKCFSSDPNALYEDLANRITPAAKQGNASVTALFDILGRHLEDKARELGIIGYPQMIFRQEYQVNIRDDKDLVNLVKRAINDQVGSEMVGLQSIVSMVDNAIEKEHNAKITPIILSTDEPEFALDLDATLGRLNPRGVFLILAGKSAKANKVLKTFPGIISIKEPTNETVEQALKTISGTVKNK